MLVERDRSIKTALWVGALIGVVFGGTGFMLLSRFIFANASSRAYSTWVLYYGGSIVQVAIFAWAAARTVHGMERSGEMELLLTTPVGAGRIIDGLWTALKKTARNPVLVLIAPSAIALIIYVATPLAALAIEFIHGGADSEQLSRHLAHHRRHRRNLLARVVVRSDNP